MNLSCALIISFRIRFKIRISHLLISYEFSRSFPWNFYIFITKFLTDDLRHIVGTDAARRGLLTVFDLFQTQEINRRLLLVLLEGKQYNFDDGINNLYFDVLNVLGVTYFTFCTDIIDIGIQNILFHPVNYKLYMWI